MDKIRPCIGCQEGCINEFVEGGHPQCAVNPRTGHEDVLPKVMPPAPVPKKIGVVGGGPAGMNFALYAAQRGHKVELLEKSGELGGIANAAAVPKNKYDMANYMQWLKRQVTSQPGVEIRLGVDATTEYLKAQNYDAVVYAVGAKRASPPIPGIDTVNMVEATELLCKPELLGESKNVVVLGGGAVGMETAYWLSYEKGCRITVIDMLGDFMEGACTANRGFLIHYIEKNGAQLVNCATIKSFEPGKVFVSRNISKGAPDPYCTWTPVLPKNIENPLRPRWALKPWLRSTTQICLSMPWAAGRISPSTWRAKRSMWQRRSTISAIPLRPAWSGAPPRRRTTWPCTCNPAAAADPRQRKSASKPLASKRFFVYELFTALGRREIRSAADLVNHSQQVFL